MVKGRYMSWGGRFEGEGRGSLSEERPEGGEGMGDRSSELDTLIRAALEPREYGLGPWLPHTLGLMGIRAPRSHAGPGHFNLSEEV